MCPPYLPNHPLEWKSAHDFMRLACQEWPPPPLVFHIRNAVFLFSCQFAIRESPYFQLSTFFYCRLRNQEWRYRVVATLEWTASQLQKISPTNLTIAQLTAVLGFHVKWYALCRHRMLLWLFMTIKASCQQLTVFWVTNCRKTRNTNRATPTAKVNIVHKGKGSNLHGYGHIRKCGSRTYFLVSHKKLGIWEPQLPSRSSNTSFAYSYHQMKRKLRCIIDKSSRSSEGMESM